MNFDMSKIKKITWLERFTLLFCKPQIFWDMESQSRWVKFKKIGDKIFVIAEGSDYDGA